MKSPVNRNKMGVAIAGLLAASAALSSPSFAWVRDYANLQDKADQVLIHQAPVGPFYVAPFAGNG